ncbi:MAG TPA: GNAT family N-acetyltransferase [Mucilaginibacter sp.]|jgi:RimJ/RimL family protein N-acetyltransferase|nr:GNAT family N-acetyltransferase [Mucilaginibacter sp.]
MYLQDDHQYTIRGFLPEEVKQYKTIRLESLQLEAAVFGSNYAREAAFTAEQWLMRIAQPNSDCFGLYCDGELIGLTGIVIDKADPTLGHMTQSYIREAYRGRGLSRLLYDTRLAWAKQHQLQTLRIGHRESNTVSKAANQRYGFKFSYREPCTWPDGTDEDILYYDLQL